MLLLNSGKPYIYSLTLWRRITTLGMFLKAEGLYREAIESYMVCIQLNPESAAVYTNLGSAYRKTGRT